MIYFTADQHFGHENVIRHCNRPYESAEEMDTALIRNWNDTVKSEDEVYILGDFTMLSAPKAHEYLTQLNGRKYFIKGNHDKFLKGNAFRPYEKDFEWIKDYHVLNLHNRQIILFHFPIAEWHQFFRKSIHLYGHVHNSEHSLKRLSTLDGAMFNVGVDVWDYRPVSIDEIIVRADKIAEDSAV